MQPVQFGEKVTVSGNAVWYQVSTIESLTLLGGLKPCAVNAIWFKYNKNAFSKQYFIRYGYLKLTARGQI
ncbi:hypothetical protein DPMN_089544 [Dreissena polymorpha]|uniref:Uncharacterized protein n=1 Tax=Dreissena polymorpha TaxID=45954 RepID=A0A9D4KYJ1_DREPO|nr:hypothetical protein DPMN_089544 [Dreissena polymorpha]